MLSLGSTGRIVRAWQSELDALVAREDAVAMDGIFGPLTEEATEAFQWRMHIGVDGIVGPVTWSAMVRALAGRATPECATKNLRASVGAPEAAAGSALVPLRLTNVGARSCETGGYPGVSYTTGPEGAQVGSAAVRVAVPPPRVVVLAPGQTATAMLREASPYGYSRASCRLSREAGLRVYPPNQWSALFVRAPGSVCANPADTALVVTPLRVVAP